MLKSELPVDLIKPENKDYSGNNFEKEVTGGNRVLTISTATTQNKIR